MIDEIDYFPRRDRHNKKKKVDSGWEDLKKQKSEQDNKVRDDKKGSRKKPPATTKRTP
ncbi:MAG: hypothetical protein ISR86_14140 [Nitrospinaceae bacterium]|nr:hypothetical protein [Deltaproteobacteria bacterium]MBL7021659.1 hypothetical protein [Nitrospinaceae bacterium]